MKQFLIHRWFLLALAGVLALGIAWAPRLQPVADARALRYAIVATVLFIMAWSLESSAVWRSLSRPWVPLLASVINFGLLPLVAWAASLLLDDQLAGGLYVVAATPCTLASAAVWTRRAGGNDSVALMVTVLTNLSCFLMTPLWLLWMTGRRPSSQTVALGAMALKLALLVVLPMVLGQLVRLRRRAAQWATAHKTCLGVVAQCGVLSMVLMGAIQTGIKLRATGQAASAVGQLLLMAAVVLVLHFSMLLTGLALARLFGFAREDCIAVGIAGSQKTLMVGLQVGLDLAMNILPMITYHVGQLLLDTLVADHFRRQGVVRGAVGEPELQPPDAIESREEGF